MGVGGKTKGMAADASACSGFSRACTGRTCGSLEKLAWPSIAGFVKDNTFTGRDLCGRQRDRVYESIRQIDMHLVPINRIFEYLADRFSWKNRLPLCPTHKPAGHTNHIAQLKLQDALKRQRTPQFTKLTHAHRRLMNR